MGIPLLNNTRTTADKSNIITYVLLIAFSAFIIGIMYYASMRDNNIKSLFLYSMCIILPFLAMFAFIILNNQDATNMNLYRIVFILLAITSIAIIAYFFLTLKSITVLSIANILNIIMILIVLIGISIAVYYVGSHLKTSPTASKSTRFFVTLITYIPCLLLDLASYIVKEYNMTTRPITILFLTEIILILLYYYLPKILKGILFSTPPIVLLPNVVYLDHTHDIANSDMLLMKDIHNSSSTEPLFRKNYAISMWIYLNVQPSNFGAYHKESNIFNYGNGMPRVTYKNEDNDNKKNDGDNKDIIHDKIIVYLSNHPEHKGVAVNIKKQKWNNLVFNYNSDTVDLFINGNLEKTVDITKVMPLYSSIDTVTIGEKNGLYGAICNIEYYTEPLSEIVIVNSYNLKNKNPPINN